MGQSELFKEVKDLEAELTKDQQEKQAEKQRAIFAVVIKKLEKHFGKATFNSWFKYLEFYDIGEENVLLSVPTRFLKDWINSHYGDEINYFWQQEDKNINAVEIITAPQKENIINPANANCGSSSSAQESAGKNHDVDNVKKISIEESFASPLDPRLTFENFVVGKPNELAHAAALSVAEAVKAPTGSNPLFMYGGVGLGKTHLMHAIAWHIKKNNPGRKVAYLSAEKFMYRFIQALRSKNIMDFKESLRAADVLMIDDVQFIGGKDSTQEEFFHTFNALIDRNKQLIITADRSPSDLDGIEERIRSRLGWGMVADVNATTYELRYGILESKAELLKVDIPKEVLEFLAHKITSNIRELEGALNKVIAYTSLFGRSVDLQSTQDILQDLLRANSKIITVEDIKKSVCDRFNLRISDMNSSRRSRSIARPRQVAMYLSKKFTTHSLPEIGRRFGGKDHTTVLHAVKKVEELCKKEPEFSAEVELLTKIIQN